MREIIDDLSSNPLETFLEDDWVLYHGTSGLYSASIESSGLGHRGGTPSYWDEVQSFICHWKTWAYVSHAFAALLSFSRDDKGIRAVSLAETFERAARYAVQEPGGETIRLMRSAISQIAEVIKKPERAKASLRGIRLALSQQAEVAGFDSEESWDAANANGDFSETFHEIDQFLHALECPEDLLKELDKFNSYRKTVEHPPIVYAIRIIRSDISHFSIDGAGLNYRGVLPPKRLLARVPISMDRDIPHPGKNSDERMEARRKWSRRINR